MRQDQVDMEYLLKKQTTVSLSAITSKQTAPTRSKAEGIILSFRAHDNVFINNTIYNVTAGVNVTSRNKNNTFIGTSIENATVGFFINTNLTAILNTSFTSVVSSFRLKDALNTTINETKTNNIIIENSSSASLNFTDIVDIYNNTLLLDFISLSNNFTFVNSTKEPNFNVSAEITLINTGFGNPEPVVDFEDDGTFINCTSPQCEKISFDGNAFVFNVSSFTAYAAAEGIPFVNQCGTINLSSILNESVNASGNCFNISADDIELDCAGFTIRYDADGTGLLEETILSLKIASL